MGRRAREGLAGQRKDLSFYPKWEEKQDLSREVTQTRGSGHSN